MTPLCELARLHQTDKGGNHYRYGGGDSDTCHNYCVHYHRLFEKLRMEPINLLEIGINRGCSLNMWAEYFPYGHIIGIDSAAECLKGGSNSLINPTDERIVTFAADQNNPDQLRRAVGDRTFDIIIDDGSHEREHQLTSLRTLLPYLKPGGIYVVEDLGHTFNQWELMAPAHELGWLDGVIKVEGGLGKAAGVEWLYWVECPQ